MRQLDIFFLSYNETKADENWQKLQQRFPRSRRVHGIKGIKNAHQKIASESQSDFFFVVDGDNQVQPEFDFNFLQSPNRETIYVWRCLNPVNDLCYGFGGIKLYNKFLLLESKKETSIDLATSIGYSYCAVPILASTTHFNTSELEAWRAAFRESVKLTKSTMSPKKDVMSEQRLSIWCQQGADRPYGSWAIKGAQGGKAYAHKHQNDPLALAKINDFNWLEQHFLEFYQ